MGDVRRAQEYFNVGYACVDFDACDLIDVIDDALDLEEGDEAWWETKYPGTYDLRPSPLTRYDDRLIRTLFDNGVHEALAVRTMSDDMTLSHCQVRRVVDTRGRPYMPWHRDTYYKSDERKWVGNTPPVHKLIVYLPDIGNDEDDHQSGRIMIVPGTHRMMFDQHDMDVQAVSSLGNTVDTRNVVTVQSSTKRALLFNTSLLHHTVPEQGPSGSVRIIYSFMTKRQFAATCAHIDHHVELNKVYESMR